MIRLEDVEQRLEGHIRRRPHGVATNWCPCCGGRRRGRKACLYVTERPWGLVACCFLCETPSRELLRALGVVPAAPPPPRTKVKADEAVLGAVRPGEIEVGVDYGNDRVGRIANALMWHLVPAREKAGIPFPAREPPLSFRFARKLQARLEIHCAGVITLLVCQRVAQVHPSKPHKRAAFGRRPRIFDLRFLTPKALANGFRLRADNFRLSRYSKTAIEGARSASEAIEGLTAAPHAPPSVEVVSERTEIRNGEVFLVRVLPAVARASRRVVVRRHRRARVFAEATA